MAEVKRICDLCGSDRTQHGEGVTLVKDWHGNGIGLVGTCCHAEATRMLNKLVGKYGGYVDEHGTVKASPCGTPTIRNFDHLRDEIGEGALAGYAQVKGN